MHPPIHFAYILILPSCFTLWSCIWKPYLNMHCGQPYLMVRYGRDRYGRGTIEGNTTPSPVPYHQIQLATYSCPQYSNRAFKRKIITWSNLEEWIWMRSVWGNACRAIVRVRIPGYAWKNRRIEKCITSLWFFAVRYGIAPGVTQTNKQTHKQTNTKRESLEAQGPTLCFYAFLPSSSYML